MWIDTQKKKYKKQMEIMKKLNLSGKNLLILKHMENTSKNNKLFKNFT